MRRWIKTRFIRNVLHANKTFHRLQPTHKRRSSPAMIGVFLRSAFELGPFCFLKSWADDGVGDEQRTFDEHAVAGEEGNLFVVGHVRELVLEAELFVKAAAGVEKAFEGQAAGGDPLGEFVVGWVVVDDGAQVAVDVVFFEPFQRFSAGGAFLRSRERVVSC